MRLALLWHGDFMDASKHWVDRGSGFQAPLGEYVLPMHAGAPFSVETNSHTVSQHGVLIELGVIVSLGDLLQLENERTREKAEGKIVTIRHSRDGKTYVGVEFTDQNINFWHMSFPVPGAKPLRRMVSAPEKVPAMSS